MLPALARRVAKPLLENALGAYLPEELDLNQLELHVPDGRLLLKSLALHAEELNRSFFPSGPVYVQTAEIAELSSKIPYKQLATQPCSVVARGVRIRMALGQAAIGPAPQELSMLLDVLPDTPPAMRPLAARQDTTAVDSLTHFLEHLLLQLHLSASDIVVELQAAGGSIFQLRIPELKAEAKRAELPCGVELLLLPAGPKSQPISLARLEPGTVTASNDDGSLSIEATFAALRLLIAPLQLQELQALLNALQPSDSTNHDGKREAQGAEQPKRPSTPTETALNEEDKSVIALLKAGLVPDVEPDYDPDDDVAFRNTDSVFKEARGPSNAALSDSAGAPAPALPPRVSLTLVLDAVCVSIVQHSSPAITFLPWTTAAAAPLLSLPNSLTMCATATRLNATHHADASTYTFSVSSCHASLHNEACHPLKLLSLSDLDEKEEAAGESQPSEHALSVTVALRTKASADEEDGAAAAAAQQKQITLRAPRLSVFYQPFCLPLISPYFSVFSEKRSPSPASSSSSLHASFQPAPPAAEATTTSPSTTQTNIAVSIGRFAFAVHVPGEGRLVAELSGLNLQGVSATETKLLGEADALLLLLHPLNGAPVLLAEAALHHSSDSAPTPLELTLRAPPSPPPLQPTPAAAANIDGVPLQAAAEGPFSAFLSSFEGRRARRVEARDEELARFRHESVAAASAVVALALPTLRLDVPLGQVALLKRIASALSPAEDAKKTRKETGSKVEDLPRAAVALTVMDALLVVRGEKGEAVELSGDSLRLLLSVRHNGGAASYAAFAMSTFRVSDSDSSSTAPTPFLFSVPRAPDSGPALSLAAELPLIAQSSPHDVLCTLRGVVFDATPRSRPALTLYNSITAVAATTPPSVHTTLPVTTLAAPSPRPPTASPSATPPPLPSTPPPSKLPPLYTTTTSNTPPLPSTPPPSRPPTTHTTTTTTTISFTPNPANTLPVVVTTPSPAAADTAAPMISTWLVAEDAWVWVDATPRPGPCARLALRIAKLDIQPEAKNTQLLLRGASFFLRADGGGRPLATDGKRPAGGAWADIGGAEFLQLQVEPLMMHISCPALKLTFCADSYASLMALTTSLSGAPPASTDVVPSIVPLEIQPVSVLDTVDENAFAPPASNSSAAGLIEDYSGEQSPLSPSLYGSVFLTNALPSNTALASSPPKSTTTLPTPAMMTTPTKGSTPAPVPQPSVSSPSMAPTRPVRGIAEAQAALKAESKDMRHNVQSIIGEDDRPRLEPVDPSGTPKTMNSNPLADLLRRMNLTRHLPAFAAHGIDLDVLRAIVAKGQEADLATLLRLSASEQAQITAAVRSLNLSRATINNTSSATSSNNGVSTNINNNNSNAYARSTREDYRRDNGAKWLGSAPEVIEEYTPAPPPQGPIEGQWKLELSKESSVVMRFYTGEDFGAGRDEAHVECRLEGLSVAFTSFSNPSLGSPAASAEISINEINAIDALQSRGPAGFALRLLCADPSQPRVLDTPLLNVQWRLVRASPEPEHWLQIHATPMSSHLTQAAWEFLARFFTVEDASPASPTTAVASGPFIQRCLMAPLSLRLSYEPEITRGIDVSLLRQGATSELLKLVPLSNSQFRFAAVDVAGVMGWSSLYNHVKLHWLAALYTQHVFSYAAGVTAVHHVGQVAEGLYELVYTPFAQSRRDGRLVLGLQRGASSAFRTLLSEAAALGLSLASSAHKLVGGTTAPAAPTAGAGLQAAYGAVARQAREAGTIVSIPLVEYQKSGTSGLVRAVLRAVPVLLLLPARGLTETAAQTLAGLREQLQGTEFHAKYAPHNR